MSYPIMKGKKFKPEKHDATGFWMSEKIDGYRCRWDGVDTLQCGKVIVAAPGWFIEGMPKGIVLDGELSGDRGTFNKVGGTLRKKTCDPDRWRKFNIKFRCFDAPEIDAGFEDRLEAAACAIGDRGVDKVVEMLVQSQARDNDHVMEELDRIEKLGGEGVMLRAPGSPYVGGKAHPYCYKVKSRHDAEAEVIGYQAGQGKHEGRLGALIVRSVQDGCKFRIGTGFSDKERDAGEDMFPIGTVVTFKYFELNKKTGVPRFPSFLRIRPTEGVGS